MGRIAALFCLCAPLALARADPSSDPVVNGNTQFAFALYERVAADSAGNLFFSPYGISSALSMISGGARGDTAAEMARVLRLEGGAKALHEGQAKLRSALATADPGCELAIANRLFARKSVVFLDAYLTLARDRYAAPVEQLDLGGHAESSRRRINDWVAAQTHDRIRDAIPGGMIDPSTGLVAVNAIYFKGKWQEPFHARKTRPMPFHGRGGDLEVPFMFERLEGGARYGRARYGEKEELEIVELPYRNGQFSMVVLLPKTNDGLARLERGLDARSFAGWLSALGPGTVDVLLPKFQLESGFRLKRPLQQMGMKRVFEEGQADLSGMTGRAELWACDLVHRSFIRVEEEGTEAAALTAMPAAAAAAPGMPEAVPLFRADHPFLFAIRHRPSGAILFLGRVLDPRGEGAAHRAQ